MLRDWRARRAGIRYETPDEDGYEFTARYASRCRAGGKTPAVAHRDGRTEDGFGRSRSASTTRPEARRSGGAGHDHRQPRGTLRAPGHTPGSARSRGNPSPPRSRATPFPRRDGSARAQSGPRGAGFAPAWPAAVARNRRNRHAQPARISSWPRLRPSGRRTSARRRRDRSRPAASTMTTSPKRECRRDLFGALAVGLPTLRGVDTEEPDDLGSLILITVSVPPSVMPMTRRWTAPVMRRGSAGQSDGDSEGSPPAWQGVQDRRDAVPRPVGGPARFRYSSRMAVVPSLPWTTWTRTERSGPRRARVPP